MSKKDISSNLRKCRICGSDLSDGSPWTLCYDEHYKTNVWGGDTHRIVASFCQSCVEGCIGEILKGGNKNG